METSPLRGPEQWASQLLICFCAAPSPSIKKRCEVVPLAASDGCTLRRTWPNGTSGTPVLTSTLV